MRLFLLVAILFSTVQVQSQSLSVKEVLHAYKKIEEQGYLKKFFASKGFKPSTENLLLFFVKCPVDTMRSCERVTIDIENNTLTYKSNIKWGNEILTTGYDFQDEVNLAGVRKSRYSLYGTNIVLCEDLNTYTPYRYWIEIFEQ